MNDCTNLKNLKYASANTENAAGKNLCNSCKGSQNPQKNAVKKHGSQVLSCKCWSVNADRRRCFHARLTFRNRGCDLYGEVVRVSQYPLRMLQQWSSGLLGHRTPVEEPFVIVDPFKLHYDFSFCCLPHTHIRDLKTGEGFVILRRSHQNLCPIFLSSILFLIKFTSTFCFIFLPYIFRVSPGYSKMLK